MVTGAELAHSQPFGRDLLQKWFAPVTTTSDENPAQPDSSEQPESSDIQAPAIEHNALLRDAHQTCVSFGQRIWRTPTLTAVLSDFQRCCLRDSLGRLYIWGDQIEWDSLAQCLEENEELRDSVLELLRDVARSMYALFTQVIHSSTSHSGSQRHARIVNSLIEKITFAISNKDHDEISTIPEGDTTYESARTSADCVISDLESYTTCLMDLLPTLESTLQQHEVSTGKENDRIGGQHFHVSEAAQHFVFQIRDKFPAADTTLLERLGEANWQRFMRIRRSQTIEDEPIQNVFKPVSEFQDSGLGSSLPAKSAYASSHVSHTSFLSSQSTASQGRLRVPPTPPEVALGESFECFLCKQRQGKIKNRIDWKLHVFADLSPYICTFAGCSQALTFFPSRASWSDHEFYQHRRKHLWRCHECLADLATTVDFSEHLQNLHSIAMSEMELTAAIEVAHHEVDIEMELQNCSLCLHPGFPTRRSFVKHVAEHLEEVALSILPREVDSDSEDESQHASATDSVSTEVRLNRSDLSPCTLSQVSADEESSAGQQSLRLRDVKNIELFWETPRRALFSNLTMPEYQDVEMEAQLWRSGSRKTCVLCKIEKVPCTGGTPCLNCQEPKDCIYSTPQNEVQDLEWPGTPFTMASSSPSASHAALNTEQQREID